MVPFLGADHGEEFAAADFVEVVGLADDWFKVDVCLVDQFVPVEVINGGEVFLTEFGEFLLEFPFYF